MRLVVVVVEVDCRLIISTRVKVSDSLRVFLIALLDCK